MSGPLLPLQVERVGFQAAGRALVSEVSFTLEAGERVLLLGPNGAGKSLLLRMLHGLLAPSAGQVRWRQSSKHAWRHQAMVFQQPVLLRRSVLANVEFALRAYGWSGDRRRQRALAALHEVHLSEHQSQPAQQLSGGQKQRLAMARAWAVAPECLFLDEPTANLDPAATLHIEQTLTHLQNAGCAYLMSSHDLGQARRLADRVLFMAAGRLLEDSPAEQFFAAPKSAQAAAYLAGELVLE